MVNKIQDIYECPFDKYLLKFIDTHLDIYKKLNFTPNMITTLSIFTGLLSMYNIFQSNFKLASLLLLCAYYFDCVDGKLARKYNMQTKFGDYYDHFGDLFKICIIVYALYKTNKTNFNNIKLILLLLALFMIIHLGYQETIYNKNDSPTLTFSKLFINFDKNPYDTIQYTKYCGCGTFILFLCIIIFFWNKENI
jgi:phosphatidylglycerophosphate synthase